MKKRLIIVIGADGSGKTSVVEALNNKLRYNTKHFSNPKDYQDAKDSYYKFLEETNENYILDRYYEGEMIFAPIYRGYDGSDYFKDLETKLKDKFDVLLVYLCPPLEVILERIAERGEDFVKEEHYEYCYKKVSNFFGMSSLNKIVFDTSLMTPDEISKNILNSF